MKKPVGATRGGGSALTDTNTFALLDTQTLSALQLTEGRLEKSTPAALDPGERFNQPLGPLQLPEVLGPYEPVKLLLPADASPAEVEALAVSLWADAGWMGLGKLRLHREASLSGPWTLEPAVRQRLTAGKVYTLAFSLSCPRQRRGQLPLEMKGVDPIADAWALSQPYGLELEVLQGLYALARRLGGALWVPAQSGSERVDAQVLASLENVGAVSSAVLLAPDPDSSVNMCLYAPVWLTQDQLASLLQSVLGPLEDPGANPGQPVRPTRLSQRIARQTEQYLLDCFGAKQLAQLRAEARRLSELPPQQENDFAGLGQQYGLFASREDLGDFSVSATLTDDVPLALRFETWSQPVCARYDFTWLDAPPPQRKLGREERRRRLLATRLIETAVVVLREVVGGEALDEDQFLVL